MKAKCALDVCVYHFMKSAIEMNLTDSGVVNAKFGPLIYNFVDEKTQECKEDKTEAHKQLFFKGFNTRQNRGVLKQEKKSHLITTCKKKLT